MSASDILGSVIAIAVLFWLVILMYWALNDFSTGQKQFCINNDHLEKTNNTIRNLLKKGESKVADSVINNIEIQELANSINATLVPATVSIPSVVPASNFNNKLSPFSNDLVNENVVLNEEDNYSDVLKDMALEKSVIDQHNQYVNDSNRVTNTASYSAERTDSQDVVPWVGLRRVDYGKKLVEATSRTVPSMDDENLLSKPVNLRW